MSGKEEPRFEAIEMLISQQIVRAELPEHLEISDLLMDEEKREILKLNRHQPAGRAELDGKKAYYLHWEFGEASGSCGLRW